MQIYARNRVNQRLGVSCKESSRRMEMEWECGHLHKKHICPLCNICCLPTSSTSISPPPPPQTGSYQLTSSSSTKIIAVASSTCGHLFHPECAKKLSNCPIDNSPIVLVNISAPPEEKADSRVFTFTLKTVIPSRILSEDNLSLQAGLAEAHYLKRAGPTAPTIKSIDVVENRALEKKFLENREKLKQAGQEDATILCYHGTPLKNVINIVERNFDLAKCANGRVYGNGVYFSER